MAQRLAAAIAVALKRAIRTNLGSPWTINHESNGQKQVAGDWISLYASQAANGQVVIAEAPSNKLPKTRVIVLEEGRIVFAGTVEEFQESDLPAIKELAALDPHDHSKDPYFPDPWDKRRRPKEEIL